MKHLVLGGVRSGKSQFAERWIAEQREQVVYIATSQVWDGSMAERVAKHQAYRPEHWQTIEEPFKLAATLTKIADQQPDAGVIVECCSLWLTNLLCAEDEAQLEAEREAFLNVLENYAQPVILVSAEVGLGIMPMNALARRYGDEIGTLNQRLAQLCDQVTLVTAGLPLSLKSC
ncbi:bifunctional adenosylcobinamide kinase/adenosylcobinamide-phosphate guanylyltransferase [Marinomonas ostreistagni]|uniref:bifunctional adenosylcobinamide kinase/adenosylcobinamide-phosphate guanylyltransferase n=1 Tax=Marinomonas ostreistagni TaxID=359209 RepID=UPI001952292F|nr:bifunctional adenosylcobinamide kinase/adenosylcobinamide-phosphate guanylyltransferase [Marinomonas ostreistagni]MBM6551092.1 bifunctional adenosylcobinamide kinase/adenosylcobinamide-phosphate guanylyltransferase [Marinomonas ostreistagni]